MVGINELTVNFGERYLFNKISFIINKSDRIGLVGKNGAGKSSLLKIIAGESESDGGNISMPSGFRVGYLPQDMDFEFGKTVMEEAKSVFKEVNSINERICLVKRILVIIISIITILNLFILFYYFENFIKTLTVSSSLIILLITAITIYTCHLNKKTSYLKSVIYEGQKFSFIREIIF